jgi:hypothetical protein
MARSYLFTPLLLIPGNYKLLRGVRAADLAFMLF